MYKSAKESEDWQVSKADRIKEAISVRQQRFDYLQTKEEYYRKLKEEQWIKLAELRLLEKDYPNREKPEHERD